MLDETVQDQKDKYHVFSLVFGIRTQCEGKDYNESLGWNMFQEESLRQEG